jgi:phosphoribosylformylglycinamidine synthase II
MFDETILQPTILEHALAEGLTEEEWERILGILGRAPNITELGIFALMWSEHCSYKSSKVHLRRLPTDGPRVLQGPGENAGAVAIGDGLAAVFKMESHNHPSFVEPYQGAATGVGGILRDVFTMGARPIAGLDSLRFGEPDNPRTPSLVAGVVKGIGDYGNCIGVPTVGGDVYFHSSYNGNILVNAFTLGVCPADKIFKGVAAGPGNPVIYVGARTGRDGIHGAGNLASKAFESEEEEKRPTVQVGDPFMEKLLLEACQELMAGQAIIGIQDMGAAGLTSSSFEMAGRAGTGIIIDLDKVPAREEGMTPYEFMLSESQERMLLVARKGKEDEVRRVFRKWDLQAEVIGQVTDDGIMRVRWQGREVACLPIAPLSDQAPVYERPMELPKWLDDVRKLDLSRVPEPKDGDYGDILIRLIAGPNLCDRSWVHTQYDSTVRTNTMIEPGAADAAVVRIKGTQRALALKSDCNSRYCLLDPFEGAKIAVAEAARNLACVGAKPLALTDCLNFGNPERPEIMWQFSRAVDGIAEACKALDCPVISGNVSFYNETAGRGIAPTPMIGMVGLIEDRSAVCDAAFKAPGDAIILLGETREELGGSEYLACVHGLEGGQPPVVDLRREKALGETLRSLIGLGVARSAHDCSEGGLAVAVTESCLVGRSRFGCRIELETGLRLDALLFGESQGRAVVTCVPENEAFVIEVANRHGVPARRIGAVAAQEEGIIFEVGGEVIINLRVQAVHESWSTAFERLINR